MEFSVERVIEDDLPHLTGIYMNSFTDQLSLRCFPRTQNVIKWWTEMNCTEFNEQPSARYIKALHGTEIIGYAKWNFPVQDGEVVAIGGDNPDEMPQWPEEGDPALCEEFFGTLALKRRDIMGNRKHAYLEIVTTVPEYRGRGVAQKLINWGLKEADELHVEAYLESSADLVGYYGRYGFREVERFTPKFLDHTEVFMVRGAQ